MFKDNTITIRQVDQTNRQTERFKKKNDIKVLQPKNYLCVGVKKEKEKHSSAKIPLVYRKLQSEAQSLWLLHIMAAKPAGTSSTLCH